MRKSISYAAALAVIGLVSMPVRSFGAYNADQIAAGYDLLVAELGGTPPPTSGVTVTQIEADNDNDSTNNDYTLGTGYFYLPAPASFPGKTFTIKSGGTFSGNHSDHADTVGSYFYGTNGFSPDVTNVNSWATDGPNGYINGYLKNSTSAGEPATDSGRVQNNSWTASTTDANAITFFVERFDYAIQRDHFVGVVALSNGSGTAIPGVLASNYNGITVGLANGNHSRGTTTGYGAGRTKPDIVAVGTATGASAGSGNYTSFATPQVSSAATMLLKYADDHTATAANAQAHPEVIKSILMAGATKSGLAGTWSHDGTHPLDAVYGAGQLNVFNSYNIIASGEQNASAVSTVSSKGWDYDTTATGAKTYFFDVASGHTVTSLSALLTWNTITHDSNLLDGANFTPVVDPLANLDLHLFNASGFSLGSELDSSLSTIDNVEHIYVPGALGAGRYALEVTGPSGAGGSFYGLAWTGTDNVPEPTVGALLVTSGLFMLRRRRMSTIAA